MKKNFNFIVLDTETGGLDEEIHQITEVGLIVLDSINLKQIHQYNSYLKPYNNLTVSPEALNATQVKMSDINNGNTSAIVVSQLIEIFKEYKINKSDRNKPFLVGHNLQFDIKFLNKLFSFHNKNLFDYVQENHLDTLTLSRILWEFNMSSDDVTNFKLKVCCERIGVSLTDAHGALNDSIATSKLFIYLINKLRLNKQDNAHTEQDQTTDRTREYFQF